MRAGLPSNEQKAGIPILKPDGHTRLVTLHVAARWLCCGRDTPLERRRDRNERTVRRSVFLARTAPLESMLSAARSNSPTLNLFDAEDARPQSRRSAV
jgi:hypothetical protein